MFPGLAHQQLLKDAKDVHGNEDLGKFPQTCAVSFKVKYSINILETGKREEEDLSTDLFKYVTLALDHATLNPNNGRYVTPLSKVPELAHAPLSGKQRGGILRH